MKRVMKTDCTGKGIALLLIIAVSLVWGVTGARAESESKGIVDTAVAAGDFNTLVAAVEAAGLVQTLKGPGPFTVFAPNDKAFKRLPEGTLQTLLKPESKKQLGAILAYHVVPGQVSAREAFGLNNTATVNGQRLDIAKRDGRLAVGSAKIIATDINCSNGVIHVIDQVLLPEQARIPDVAEKAGQFNTLLAAVSAAGLADVLNGDGPFTVFCSDGRRFRLASGRYGGNLAQTGESAETRGHSEVPCRKRPGLYGPSG